jgi:hypothetical protein
MDGVLQEHVQVALGHVGTRVADLLRAPAVLHSMENLSGRARVDAHGIPISGASQVPDKCQSLRSPLGLEGQAHPVPQPGSPERRLKRPDQLLQIADSLLSLAVTPIP